MKRIELFSNNCGILIHYGVRRIETVFSLQFLHRRSIFTKKSKIRISKRKLIQDIYKY